MKKTVKVIVLRAAGTNCENETAYAFQTAGAETELVHINRVANGEIRLDPYSILAIPGGFSYGDDISAGRILANELTYKVAEQLESFVASGKLIIGICNGFQVLIKTGLLPGFAAAPGNADITPQRITLFDNDNGRYECRWVNVKLTENSPCVFTKGLPEIITLPIAHAEGKIVFDSPATLKKLNAGNQGVFRYVDADGNPGPFPINPNGSEDGLAGICNATGRVFGLMPHPERNIFPTHNPRWTRSDCDSTPHGLTIFKNAVTFAAKEI